MRGTHQRWHLQSSLEHGTRGQKVSIWLADGDDDSDLDKLERRILSSFSVSLQDGQRGLCGGESLKIDFVVENASLKEVRSNDIEADGANESTKPKAEKLLRYPKVTKVAIVVSGTVDDDWINLQTK